MKVYIWGMYNVNSTEYLSASDDDSFVAVVANSEEEARQIAIFTKARNIQNIVHDEPDVLELGQAIVLQAADY